MKSRGFSRLPSPLVGAESYLGNLDNTYRLRGVTVLHLMDLAGEMYTVY